MQASTIGRRYGWRPPHPSINVRRLSIPLAPVEDLPQAIDGSGKDFFRDPYDQETIGSCTANALGGLVENQIIITKYAHQFRPSRLQLYYDERDIEGTTQSDSGAAISDGIKALQTNGICPEIEYDGSTPGWLWPYDTSKYTEKPPAQCYLDAKLHKALKESSVSLDRTTVLNLLAQQKPFAFGFTVHQSFESQQMATDGIMHVPSVWDLTDPQIGGHAVVACGYVLGKEMGTQGIKDWVLVRNSWGAWGATADGGKGHFWAPLDQIICNSNVTSDAWTIDLVGH